MSDDNYDLVAILARRDFGTEPFFQGLDWPSQGLRSRSRLNQQYIATVDNKLSVESFKPRDIRMDVINQAHLETSLCKGKEKSDHLNRKNQKRSSRFSQDKVDIVSNKIYSA